MGVPGGEAVGIAAGAVVAVAAVTGAASGVGAAAGVGWAGASQMHGTGGGQVKVFPDTGGGAPVVTGV